MAGAICRDTSRDFETCCCGRSFVSQGRFQVGGSYCDRCWFYKITKELDVYPQTFHRRFRSSYRWCPKVRRILIILSRASFGSSLAIKLPKELQELIFSFLPYCTNKRVRDCEYIHPELKRPLSYYLDRDVKIFYD